MAVLNNKLAHITSQQAARFKNKINQRSPDECWPFTGRTDPDGYGIFTVSDGPIRAHRIIFYLHTGVHPNDFCVLHTCDNPPCCNPAHLFLGTNADNMRDKCQKGRQSKGGKHAASVKRRARGERNGGGAKLTNDAVRAIRNRANTGEAYRRIALDYGVSAVIVSKVARRLLWKHVE